MKEPGAPDLEGGLAVLREEASLAAGSTPSQHRHSLAVLPACKVTEVTSLCASALRLLMWWVLLRRCNCPRQNVMEDRWRQ